MKNELKMGILIPILIILLGALLLAFMIKIEDEPGALPLIVILTGIVFLIVNWFKLKRNKFNNY